jgi:hypothetical protein
MSAYDLDPIIDECEMTHDMESVDDMRPCEGCGDFAMKLTAVNDNDPSVGYRDIILLCDACLQDVRRSK